MSFEYKWTCPSCNVFFRAATSRHAIEKGSDHILSHEILAIEKYINLEKNSKDLSITKEKLEWNPYDKDFLGGCKISLK